MDDLIPFVIFLVIAVINLLKYVAEKGGRKTPSESPADPEGGRPKTGGLENFFEDLARKFEPQPIDLPDWPEGSDRPDYVEEMEQFETGMAEAIPEEKPLADVVPVMTEHIAPRAIIPEIQPIAQLRGLESAMRAIPAMAIDTSGMRIKTPPLLPSGQTGGRLDFPLRNRNVLRQAIIANIVFSPPRACCTSFDNSTAV
jgi:hypothetical protein